MDNQITSKTQSEIENHLQTIEQLLTVEQERIAASAGKAPPFPELPEELRWRLMALACSLRDHLLWITPCDSQDGPKWELTEIETGVSTVGADAADACRRYFTGEIS